MDLNQYDELLLAQKMLALGNKYIVTDAGSNVLLYSKQKLFRLKEDFRFYTDQAETSEFLKISAQNIIDFSGKYTVSDSSSGAVLGIIKREGLRSLLRGKWLILSPSEEMIAEVHEDSIVLAVLRRVFDFITLVIPVKFDIVKGDTALGVIEKKRALIRDRYYIDLRNDTGKVIDRRLAVALSVLLDSINRQ
ncbi:hypothetical protein A2716_04730 [candidate division WWE3 bacterium RIFCSPHIGHO2_01_FULL_40_23]|uniref:Uncharacterized protein n=1 Tax=candidate division WWE3 bacterium RIFCSPLOWO2_01_FULL_41_18 TaxID=1802625 RepID=A0A1F4VD31_UNCKA|nr:MAG: hypothetical protein A2716_04730 [candidate division WWE3 bacterium RIFCSPHIGHO2_01_FULL_40_23]OGC55176.1 MAG: hypothetical protein A3A78_04340 [candidate division WWE3 bacterium RIFCSPLOWO2_01_FULL_41_18]